MAQKIYGTFMLSMVLTSTSVGALSNERSPLLSRACATLGYAAVCSSMYACTSLQRLYHGDADSRAAFAGLIVSGVILGHSGLLLMGEIKALYEKERKFFQML